MEEQILDETKKDFYNHYSNEEQLYEVGIAKSIHEDNFDVKPEFVYLSETYCKKEFGACECTTCICKPEGMDLVSSDDTSKDYKVKLEESGQQEPLSNDNNTSAMPNPYLQPTDCVEYDEEKVDISETKVNSVMPVIDLKDGIQPLNSDKCVDGKSDLTTEASNDCKKTTTITDLSKKSHSVTPISCPECKKKISNKLRLDAHIMSSHSDDLNLLKTVSSKTYDCPKCKKQFMKKFSLAGHIMSNHNNDQDLLKTISRQTHECPKCSEQFIYKSHLNTHLMEIHKDGRNLLETISGQIHDCPKCSEQFINVTNLHRHMLNRHKNEHLWKKTFSNSLVYL